MLSKIELALQIASDRVAVDVARVKTSLVAMFGTTRGDIVAGVVSGDKRRVMRALGVLNAHTVRVLTRGVEDINSKHQTYIAEELRRVIGPVVTVERVPGETASVTVMGDTLTETIHDRFAIARRLIRLAGDDVSLDAAGKIVDKLEMSMLMTLMVFCAVVDVDNKTRVTEGLVEVIGDNY